MTARRRPPIAVLLLLALLGGTAAVYFAEKPPAPRLGGPHRIERSPISVVSGEVPAAPGADPEVPADPAEVLHPADVLVRVLTRDDAPVPASRVSLRDPRSTWTAVADGRGEVPFAGVEAGPCTVLARAEGFAERRLFARLAEGPNPEVVLRLGEAPAVEGRVVSSLDGSPVAGAAIHAVPNPGMDVGEREAPSAVADAAGAFRLRAGATGQALTLHVRAKGFVPGRRYLPLSSNNDDVVRVEIPLDPTGILRGVVLDSSGRPCPDAAILAYPAGTDRRPRDWGVRKWSPAFGGPLGAGAGPDGRYSLEGLARGGLYLVAASFPGYAPSEEREIFFPPGETEVRADFTLRSCGGVLVKWPVGTRNNEGTGSATLRDPGAGVVVAMGGGSGSCRFPEVAPGRYEATVEAPNANRKGSASVEVKAGETAIVEITFTGPMEGEAFIEAAIEGFVTDGEGAPVPGVKVGAVPVVPEAVEPRLFTRSGVAQIPGRGPVRVSSMAGTREDGRFRIEGLKEGSDYRLLATARGRFARPEESVRAPASGIEVVLSGLGRLKGRLVLPAGAEAPLAMELRVGGADPADPFRTVASAGFLTGVFDTGDLIPGPCWLTAIAGEWLLPPRVAEVRPGETVDCGDLPLARGAVISGRVVDSAGTPIPRVQIVVRDALESHAMTGEDGRFEVGPLAEGEATLSLALLGQVPLMRNVSAVPGGDVGDLLLPREGRLLVRAVREGGRPWAGEVEVRGASAGSGVVVLGRTDHMGRFAFSLPAREYLVVIRDPADRTRVLAEAPASLAEGADTRVELRVGR